MMLKKLLSICARPGYKIPKNVLKIYQLEYRPLKIVFDLLINLQILTE